MEEDETKTLWGDGKLPSASLSANEGDTMTFILPPPAPALDSSRSSNSSREQSSNGDYLHLPLPQQHQHLPPPSKLEPIIQSQDGLAITDEDSAILRNSWSSSNTLSAGPPPLLDIPTAAAAASTTTTTTSTPSSASSGSATSATTPPSSKVPPPAAPPRRNFPRMSMMPSPRESQSSSTAPPSQRPAAVVVATTGVAIGTPVSARSAQSMSSLDTGGGDENTQTHTHTRPNGLVNVAHVRRYSFNTDSSSSPSTTPGSLNTSIGTGGAAGYDDEGAAFLLARLEAQKNDPKPVSGFDPFSFIRTSFNAVRDSMNAQEEKTATEEEMDWDFWGKVISDYDKVALKQSRVLSRKIQFGIPSAIRGMVWQLFSKGKNPELENVYSGLQNRTSTHEKLIQRDLSRTFPKHDYFQPDGPGQEALFNVIKAYSLYDQEVGYCQGISFVVGALLLNMPEEEAFCVLVQLMKQYNFRELYTPNMVGLRMRLYQFESVLKEHLPAVEKHLENEGVKSTMYASQWFMTMFAYRFPLEFVFRIMDMIFAEGIESMFRIAIALLKKNRDVILTMEFETVVEYLKNGLFDVYLNITTNNLIADAAAVKITKARLDKLQAEFEDQLKKETDINSLGSDQLRTQNRHMSDQLKKLESAYELLNREHIALANENVEKTNLIEKLLLEKEELLEQVNGLRSVVQDDRMRAEKVVKDEMDGLMRKNLGLTSRNVELQDHLNDICVYLVNDLSHKLSSEDLRTELNRKVGQLTDKI